MPKIKILDEQNDALREVSEMLKDVEGINKFLESENESDEFTISYTSTGGKTVRAKLHVDKAQLDKLLKKNKASMSSTAKKLCARLHIEMEPEEKAALGLDQPAQPEQPENLEQPAQPEQSDPLSADL